MFFMFWGMLQCSKYIRSLNISLWRIVPSLFSSASLLHSVPRTYIPRFEATPPQGGQQQNMAAVHGVPGQPVLYTSLTLFIFSLNEWSMSIFASMWVKSSMPVMVIS